LGIIQTQVMAAEELYRLTSFPRTYDAEEGFYLCQSRILLVVYKEKYRCSGLTTTKVRGGS
jgi:hypothetical protein